MAKSLEGKLEEVRKFACCGWPERAVRAEYENEHTKISRDWYKSRCDELLRWQSTIPDPYRNECCDILANGKISPWHTRKEPATSSNLLMESSGVAIPLEDLLSLMYKECPSAVETVCNDQLDKTGALFKRVLECVEIMNRV